MYTALSGQLAAFKHLEVIANNLANMTTNGYRAERILFEKALTQEQQRSVGGALSSDVQQPSDLKTDDYVAIAGSFTDFAQGPVDQTGNPLDVAIQGKGLFVVNTPDGERYTRAGNFRLDTSNRLVTQEGDPVQGTSGDITINGHDINITGEGAVLADNKEVGRLRIVEIRPQDLSREPNQRFKLHDGASVQEVQNVTIRAGAIEGSNVNAVRELTDMIMASRIYDSFQKAQDANSKMSDLRNNRVGSTQG